MFLPGALSLLVMVDVVAAQGVSGNGGRCRVVRCVGVGQCWVVDGLAYLGLVRGLQQPQVVDAGGFHRRGGVRFHRGVHVAADGVRDGAAHRPALVFDLDDGQVERGEQQVDGAPDQRRVDLVAVAC